MRSVIKTPLIRYLAAGGTAFAAEYLMFLVLYSVAGAQIYLSNTASFLTGLIISFTLNRGWSFKAGAYHHKRHHQLVMYAILALFNLLLTNVLIGILKNHGLDPKIAKFLIMFLVVIWNFLIFRKLIFKQSLEQG